LRRQIDPRDGVLNGVVDGAGGLGILAMGRPVFSRRRAAIKSVATVLWLLIADQVVAAYSFQKIVDTSSAIPGGVGTFTAFDETAYDGNYLSFRARGAGGQEGVYLWDGAALSAVADVSTAAPEGAGQFDDFLALSLDAGHVAFVASGTVKDGVYTTLGGVLRRVADTSMTMPSSTVPFTQFTFSGDVAITGDNIVFSAFGANETAANAGVYRESGGALMRVADRTTAIPEFDGSFIFFSAVDAWTGEALFAGGQGTGGGNGFYTTAGASAGQLRAVLNADSAVPGLSNPISIFSPNTIRIDGAQIAFSAADSVGGRGVYLDQGGLIQTIADKNTLDPVTGVAFTSLGTAYSLSAGAVAFQGSSTGPTGLYVHKIGTIHNIIHASTMLDSKIVASVGLYGESLANDNIAFRATFTDGTSGIYVATSTITDPNVHLAEFSPLFDAGSSGGNVVDGEEQITVQNHAGVERRACLEFDVSQLPTGAVIERATLRLNVNALTSPGGAGGPSLTVYGYAGNGVLDASDPQRTDVWLGETTTAIELGALEIQLQATPLKSLAAASGIVGLVVLADVAEHLVGFDALENVGGSPPELVIEYSLAPGDFNGDGAVDSSDLAVWKSNFGQLSAEFSQGDADGDADVDGSDFLIWQRGYTASAVSVVIKAPESTTLSLFLTAAGLIAYRRLPRGFSSYQLRTI
jgi:hypothetical protein